MFILLWLPDTDRRCLVSLYQIIVFKIQSDSLEAALRRPHIAYGTRAELLARMGCCSAGRPVPPSYPLAPPGASLVWPARPAGRNPVPVDLFSAPAIQPNFSWPAGTSTSPATFQVTGRNFRVGARSFCVGRPLPAACFSASRCKDFGESKCAENQRVGSPLVDGDGRDVFSSRWRRLTRPPLRRVLAGLALTRVDTSKLRAC